MPTGFLLPKPAFSSASSTVAPSGRKTESTFSRRGSAHTTSTLSATVHLPGAVGEGVDHGVGDAVEERLEELAQRPAGHLVLERELDLAALRRERPEAPGAGEGAERPLLQAHVDRLARAVLVAGGERLAQAGQARGQRGARLARMALVHGRLGAPRQEARIGLDVLDQRVHGPGAVRHDRRALYPLHDKIRPRRCPSSRTARLPTTISSRSATRPASPSKAGR